MNARSAWNLIVDRLERGISPERASRLRALPDRVVKPSIPPPPGAYDVLDELANRYGTDKGSQHHNYVRHYAEYFSPYRSRHVELLEIGVKDGASLRMWKDFFQDSHIVGIDNRDEALRYVAPGIDIYVGLQQDHEFLELVASSVDGFDIVLDDGSHHNPYTIESFRGLFKHLVPGGLYVIEDLHCSYEEHRLFNNERSQMTDFLVELMNAVDLNGRRDIYRHVKSAQDFGKLTPELRAKLTPLERWVESVHVHQGLVFVHKREAGD